MTDKKGNAVPVRRTAAQAAAIAKRAAEKAREDDLAEQVSAADEAAARSAQIANLLIGGHTMASIAAATGQSEDELEQMLAADSARFIRSQKSLRVWTRRYISERYSRMLEANIDAATDKMHPARLENQDRVLRILAGLERLHGAAAPTQTEVSVEAAPEAIERMVALLAAEQGKGYDPDIFTLSDDDVTEVREVAHAAPANALAALEAAADATEQDQPEDRDL